MQLKKLNFVQRLRRRTPLGWLQLSHEKGRLAVALSGVAFADILMLMQLGFQGALFQSAVRIHETLNADIVLASPQMRNMMNLNDFSRRRLYQSLDVVGVESADPLYATMASWKHPTTRKNATMLMFGVNPDRPFVHRPDINRQLDRLKIPDTLLFDQKARGDYQVALEGYAQGKPMTTEIKGRKQEIRGLFEVGSSFGADGSLVTSTETFLRLYPNRGASNVSLGLIRLKPGADLQQTTQVLRQHLPDDVRVYTLDEFIAFEKNYWATNTPIGFIFRLGVGMGFVVGVILVYQVLSTDVNAHLQEYATFRAMGYSQLYLLGIVLEEAIILAVIGFIPGVAISTVLYQLTRNATSLPVAMSLARAGGVLLATIVMCLISGAIATRRLGSADPADIF
ncbi:FtsX-like permease family protein [filamentous cyanobacterium LEGE 11480]|uniref:FtsX-like permease family protein n=2 Tax=Romeriopsis TaxID=2992131 RepID=A0A928Z179_9CYAN|nr:FtsX-like permease family protein [Romeriopsis navalis LEGE 11480]